MHDKITSPKPWMWVWVKIVRGLVQKWYSLISIKEVLLASASLIKQHQATGATRGFKKMWTPRASNNRQHQSFRRRDPIVLQVSNLQEKPSTTPAQFCFPANQAIWNTALREERGWDCQQCQNSEDISAAKKNTDRLADLPSWPSWKGITIWIVEQ